MSSYIFRQRCRPRADFRIDEIMAFLHLFREAFKCVDVYDSNSKPVDLTESALRKIIERRVDRIFPTIGANIHFFTIPPRKRDDETVGIEIHTGTHPDENFIDTYNISMGSDVKVPDLSYFERSIEIFKPFEGFLAEGENEYRLNAYDRQQAIPKFDRPAIIRGFHYLDAGMARSIGGIEYCLKAPVWKVEQFCEGVLIWLVPGLFDHENPEHLQVQRKAMKYFKLL
jgi:hypothetical protein